MSPSLSFLDSFYIRMQDPLKQGLKQRVFLRIDRSGDSNARSIKTRIETGTASLDHNRRNGFECKIH